MQADVPISSGDAPATLDLTSINSPPTATAGGQIVFGSDIVPVNTATAGYQDHPQIAALKDGGYVVAWQDGDPSGFGAGSLGVGGATGDSSGTAIKAQVFTADGDPSGSEILVNTTTAGDQATPAITTLDDGNFVVTWSNAGNIDGQLFSAAGVKEGAEFQVNTSASASLPSITALAGGGFTVVWSSFANIFQLEQLEAQTFGADGSKVGPQFAIGDGYAGITGEPPANVTALSGGGFAVTWIDRSGNVEAQAFSATGTPVSAPAVFGADTFILTPTIAALNNGGFAVTWADSLSHNINAQTFSATGAKVGPQIVVDHVGEGAPTIATLSNGDFVIAWTTGAGHLMAQVFTPDSEAATSPITVSTNGVTPELIALPNGQFAVTFVVPSPFVGDEVVSSVYTATGAFVGEGGIVQVGAQGTPAAALANNGVAFAWSNFNGSDLDVSEQSFHVGYQEIAGQVNLKNTGFSVGDVDGLDGIETLTLSVTEGVLNVAAGGSGATVTGSGSGLVTIDGTIAEINALLNTDNASLVSFIDANPDPAPHVTLTMTMDDHGNSGAGSALTATATATIEAATQLVNTGPGLVLAQKGVATEIAGLSVVGRDSEIVTTTLQDLSGIGTLTVGAVDGAVVSGSGTQQVTISGTLAQVDAVLSAANNVLYQGNFFGIDLLEMTSHANGSSDVRGPLTADTFVRIAVGIPAMLGVVASGAGIVNGVGDLNAGHVVTFTIQMSDAVFVSGGTPFLSLDDGGTATYSGGSGTDALTFIYQVAPGENTTSLFISQFDTGGASLQNASGHDADFNVLNPLNRLAPNLQIDTAAPTVSIVADHTALSAGQTSTVTFTFSEAVSFALGDAAVTGGSLSHPVHVGLNSSGQDIYTATFTPDAVNNEAGSVAVNDQSYSDLAGNNGAASNTVNFSGDTLAPAVPSTPDLFSASDSGASNADNLTHVTTPIFVGTAEAGSTVNLFDTDDTTALGSVVATDGTYSITASTLSEGFHTVTARATDADGNVSTASGSLTVDIDTSAPGAPTVALAHDTGSSAADHITGNPSLVYTPSDNADTLLYKADAATAFLTTAPTFAADGSHTVQVEEQDAAGNISHATSFNFALDTTAPTSTGIAALPGSGIALAGATVEFVFSFDEAVNVGGGTPTLSLNGGASAVYDPAATAALHDATKLAFDYLVSSSDPFTTSLSVTGLVAHGATVADLAGNAANLGQVAATFPLQINKAPPPAPVNETIFPAFTIGGGIVRPALTEDSTGHIVLDVASAAFAETYGLKLLYAGLPATTPFPPIDPQHDFHLL